MKSCEIRIVRLEHPVDVHKQWCIYQRPVQRKHCQFSKYKTMCPKTDNFFKTCLSDNLLYIPLIEIKSENPTNQSNIISSSTVDSPFSSDTPDNKKSLLSMKKLEEIIKNFNISSTQTIPDAHFVNGLLSFHRGMQTLSHQGFCNHLRSLASQFHHLGIHFLKTSK